MIKMISNTSDQYFLNLKKNQIKMIKARGYNTSEEEWILNENLTAKEFRKKLLKKYGDNYPRDYSIRKLMYSEYTKEKGKPLFVYFIGLTQGGKQIKVDSIRPFINKMTEEDKNGLLVIDSVLSTEASKCLSYVTESKFQIYKEEELTFDLISVIMIPKHIIVNDTVKIKSDLTINGKSVAMIHSTDPVARYYHFLPGQIVKVISENDVDLIYDYSQDHCLII
jgi:DNA-directed RNA polymerase subunit H (RpoH/RPB5)